MDDLPSSDAKESMLHVIDRRNDRINPNYMVKQKDINKTMRAILVDWLVNVKICLAKTRGVTLEHLFCGVRLVDWFLSKRGCSRTKLQLIGMTGLLLAQKFDLDENHDHTLTLGACVYICDGAYTRDQFIQMEAIYINTLQSAMTAPSWLFLPADAPVKARALLLLSLGDYCALEFRPSQLAEGAVAFYKNPAGREAHCTREYFLKALGRKRKYLSFKKLLKGGVEDSVWGELGV